MNGSGDSETTSVHDHSSCEGNQHPGNPSGRDHKVGAGMINPIAALTAVLPSEREGALSPQVAPLLTDLGDRTPKDNTPLVVALSGTGIGLGLLLLTLFVVHTMNRGRTFGHPVANIRAPFVELSGTS